MTCHLFSPNDFQCAACRSSVVWQKGGSFCRVLRGGQSKCQSKFWYVQIGFQVGSINSTSFWFRPHDLIKIIFILLSSDAAVSAEQPIKSSRTQWTCSARSTPKYVSPIALQIVYGFFFFTTYSKASSNFLRRNPNTSAPTGQCCAVWEKHSLGFPGHALPNSRKRWSLFFNWNQPTNRKIPKSLIFTVTLNVNLWQIMLEIALC